MIASRQTIERDSVVSSIETREWEEKVRYELSSIYHRSLSIVSELNALSSMLVLTEKSSIPLLRKYMDYIDFKDYNMVLTASTIRTDPEELDPLEKAESHSEFGSISAKRIETVSTFLNLEGRLKNNIKIVRTTLNGIVDEAPDSIIENNAVHVFDNRVPYIINFKKEGLERATVYFDISSSSIPLELNAIRFIPYPGMGGVVLDGMWKDGANEIKGVTGTNYIAPEYMSSGFNQEYDKYTMPAYIHIERVKTGNLKLGFSSRNYISEMAGIIIGIGSLVGELNIYAQNSYAGYTIELPEGKKLSELNIISDPYFNSLPAIRALVYNDKTEFDSLSDRYEARCAGNTMGLNIQPDINNKLYILVELTSNNNISPALSKISLRYS